MVRANSSSVQIGLTANQSMSATSNTPTADEAAAARDEPESSEPDVAAAAVEVAASENAAKNSPDRSAATDLLSGIRTTALPLDAIGIGSDRKPFALPGNAREFYCQQRITLIVRCLLCGDDAAGNRCALPNHNQTIRDDVRRDRAREGLSLLCSGAVESLSNADRNGGSGRNGDIAKRRRRWRDGGGGGGGSSCAGGGGSTAATGGGGASTGIG